MKEHGKDADAAPSNSAGTSSGTWSERYGEKHRLQRIDVFPRGIVPPKRVRIYERAEHFVLQWWDPAQKKTLSDRVDGDLVEAIGRARQIEERLEHFRGSGHQSRKIGHQELVDRFLADLVRRADAGEIDPHTVRRYGSALREHYLPFALQPEIERQFRWAAGVNRDFQLAFATYLNSRQIRPNGHANSQPRPMSGQHYVLDVVRSLYAWAADPDRGRLLPEGFRNPFVLRTRSDRRRQPDQLGEPDITLPMACAFLEACDAYQLRLFAPIAFYGLRAAEPCFLCYEDLDRDWLRVRCREDLAYWTKGRRDKHLPMTFWLHDLLLSEVGSERHGLIYVRRDAWGKKKRFPLLGAPVKELIRQFQGRCQKAGVVTATARRRIRDAVLAEAGGITYDHIVAEFRSLHKRLGWPKEATLKDLRHLLSTILGNSAMQEHYRKYFLGQTPGRAAIVTYTHLNELRQRYEDVLALGLRPLVDTIVRQQPTLAT